MASTANIKHPTIRKLLTVAIYSGLGGYIAFEIYVRIISILVMFFLLEPIATFLTIPPILVGMLIASKMLRGMPNRKTAVLVAGASALAIVRACEQILLTLGALGICNPNFMLSRSIIAIVAAFAGLLIGTKVSSRKSLSEILIAIMIIIGVVGSWAIYDFRLDNNIEVIKL